MDGRARDHQRPIPTERLHRQGIYLGHAIANTNSVTECNPNFDANTDGYGHGHRIHPQPQRHLPRRLRQLQHSADRNAYPNSYTNCNSDGNTIGDSHTHSHSDRNSHSDGYRNSHGNANINSNCNSYAKTNAHSTASPDTKAPSDSTSTVGQASLWSRRLGTRRCD